MDILLCSVPFSPNCKTPTSSIIFAFKNKKAYYSLITFNQFKQRFGLVSYADSRTDIKITFFSRRVR